MPNPRFSASRRALASLLLGLVGARAAHAEEPPHPIVATGHTTLLPGSWVTVERPSGQSWNPLRGTFYDNPRALALTEFQLTADEGDHHIRVIAAEANAGKIRTAAVAFNHRTSCGTASFCDDPDPFPWSWRIGMILPNPDPNVYWTTEAVVEHCAGSCVVKMPLGRAGYRFVLAGFRVARPLQDAYVRRISVMPEPNGDVRVRFQDNGNPDFSASISGLWIQEGLIEGDLHDDTVVYDPGNPAPKIAVGSGPYALVGFDLEFLNGDHKLHEIGLRYTAPHLLPKLADKNTDDPWRARVRWVKLAS